jgi:hypothetical protein
MRKLICKNISSSFSNKIIEANKSKKGKKEDNFELKEAEV